MRRPGWLSLAQGWRWAWLLFIVAVPAQAKEDPGAPAPDAKVFAVIGGEAVAQTDYEQFLQQALRGRFYHGRASALDAQKFEEEVTRRFIDRVLLRQEAVRRGINVDPSLIAERTAKRAASVGSDGKAVLESAVRSELLIERLEGEIRRVSPPSEAAARAYYHQHPEKFTVPERVRVAVILLKVPPYAPAARWQARLEEAKALRQQVLDGKDFGTLARVHSEHETAQRGGDLGLVHAGMLIQELQGIVDSLQVGDLAEPAAILQGVVLVRLDERQPAELMPFERASDRAQRLLQEERGEEAWQAFLRDLREKTPVTRVSGEPGL